MRWACVIFPAGITGRAILWRRCVIFRGNRVSGVMGIVISHVDRGLGALDHGGARDARRVRDLVGLYVFL